MFGYTVGINIDQDSVNISATHRPCIGQHTADMSANSQWNVC